MNHIKFANDVLEILSDTDDWGPDTLDAIAQRAVCLGLARSSDDGLFEIVDPE